MTRKIAVLGGGIAGLSASWNLISKGGSSGLEVVLYEASNRVGGWMRTESTSEGAVFECGPRSLRTVGRSAKTTMKLVSEIGLDSEVLPASSAAVKKRLIYTNSTGLVQLPDGLSWLFRAKPPFTKPLLGALTKELFTKAGSGDETVHDFFSRRTSSELTKYLIDPLCRGVYAASARTLSMRACFPHLVDLERKYGSLVKGMFLDRSSQDDMASSPLSDRAKKERWSVYSFRNGLQTLPDTLLTRITEKGVRVRLECPCSQLTFQDGKAKVEAGGEVEQFDHVVSALPAKALSQVLTEQPQLSADLSSIPYVSVGVVGLEYKAADILPLEHREAFGYLVPSSEVSRILGVVFDSASFPAHNRKDTPTTRLTVMMGGEWFGELFGDPSTAHTRTLSQVALEELHRQLGIAVQPSYMNTLILQDGIPQYTIGHNEKLDSIAAQLSGLPLLVCGSSYRGVSVNDCVHQALEVTDKMLQ